MSYDPKDFAANPRTRNQLYRRDEPVYLCESAGKDHGYFYASTLENFVL